MSAEPVPEKAVVAKLTFQSKDIEHQRSKFSDEAFFEMKTLFPGESDESLARFLIARNGDISKAAPFLQKSIDWRTAKLPVTVPSFYREFIKGKIYIHGTDKNGHSLIG